MPCRRCGYNLRGLELDGICPECGALVRVSLIGDFLAAADPAHITRLFRGAILVEVTFYIYVLVSCVASPIALAIAVPRAASGLSGALLSVLHLALALLAILGWWLVSSPDPGRMPGSRGDALRRALRLCLILSACFTLIATFGTAIGSITSDPALSVLLVRGGAVLGACTWLVQYFASTAYVRVLALRIPSPELASTARSNIHMPLWTFGLGVPFAVITALVGVSVPAMVLLTILCLAAMAIASLVWFIWYCSMISGLRDRLDTVRLMMPQVAAD